jgi:hypothetical protein
VKNFIAKFDQWSRVFENESEENVNQKIEDLRQLVDLGMIDQHEITAFLRKRGVPDIIEHVPEIQEIINSPEYLELQEHGLGLVSSRTQLLRGNILLGFPGYRPHDGYAIGIYPGVKLIRRMTPKGIWTGVRGRTPYGIGSMDFLIKKLDFVPDDQFYRVAMRWILDHIDLEDPQFSVKRKTRKGYFNHDQDS